MSAPNPQPAPAACPSPDKLADFSSGRLSFAELDSVSEHMSGCLRCESTLASLADARDELVKHLRELSAAAPFVGEPLLEAEMAAAERSAQQPDRPPEH